MKIQKQLSKKVGNKIYHKYVIVLPEELIKNSELNERDEIEGLFEKHKIILRKKI